MIFFLLSKHNHFLSKAKVHREIAWSLSLADVVCKVQSSIQEKAELLASEYGHIFDVLVLFIFFTSG